MKKRILIVNDMLQGGGVEKLLSDLVWHWHEKYDITVMTYAYCTDAESLFPADVRYFSPTPPHALIETKTHPNMAVRLINRVYNRIKTAALQNQFQKMQFDVLITIKDGWLVEKTAQMDIPRKLAWIHTDYKANYYTKQFFGSAENERACMMQFAHVVCVAEQIRENLIEVIGDPGNLIVRENPIRVDNILFRAEEPVLDIDCRKDPQKVRFVTVGRLNQQKGYDLLLEACHMLERDGLQFEVWIVGGEEPWGDEHLRLYRRQKALGLTSVRFLGPKKNPYKYMKQADWFVSSSVFEGYSLVSQEAAILGIPMLLTDCSGVRELLEDNEYGIVMPISVAGIYENMKRVIEDPQLRLRYRDKIIERSQRINFEQRVHAIEELLEE